LQECDCFNGQLHFLLLIINHKEYIDVTDNIHNKYYYDHNGNRVLKEEYDSSNNLVKSTRYYYVKNVLGNILAVIDNNKSKVVEYSYNAWGEVTSTGGTLAHINPFRYKSYYYDSDIKMYYCKSRYYVPSWKRWLNADSPRYLNYGSSNYLNLFTYCLNRPVELLDNLGTYPVKLINRLDKTEYFVNHTDGGYVSSNQIIEGTTDAFWKISNKVSGFIRKVDSLFNVMPKEKEKPVIGEEEPIAEPEVSSNPEVSTRDEEDEENRIFIALELLPDVNSSSYLKGNSVKSYFTNLDDWCW